MKKAFTLAETLITLDVLGIVAAITLPQLNKIRIDKDKTFYTKSLMSIQSAMIVAMDSPFLNKKIEYLDDGTMLKPKFWADDSLEENLFCKTIAETLNTTGDVDCSGNSQYENPNFITTDGIRFWNLDGKFTEIIDNKESKVIYVDRKLSNTEIKDLEKNRDQYHKIPGLKIVITYKGKVKTLNTKEYNYENEIIKNLQNLQKE